HQAEAELFKGAENHQQAGAFFGQRYHFVGDRVAGECALFIDGEHVTGGNAFPRAAIDDHHIHFSDLAHAAFDGENEPFHFAVRRRGEEVGVHGPRFVAEQAILDPDLLCGAGHIGGGDVTVDGAYTHGADVPRLNTQHLTGHRILVHVALAVDTVDGQALVEIAAGVEEVAGADNQALVGTRQYIGRVFHLTREYDAAIGKEGVDGVQRNGGNRFRQRNHMHGRTELDGARLDLESAALIPTFYRQPRLAVQIDEADDVTG